MDKGWCFQLRTHKDIKERQRSKREEEIKGLEMNRGSGKRAPKEQNLHVELLKNRENSGTE